jgi:hypothetical protein
MQRRPAEKLRQEPKLRSANFGDRAFGFFNAAALQAAGQRENCKGEVAL